MTDITSKVDSALNELKQFRLIKENRGVLPPYLWLETVYEDGYMGGVGITDLALKIGCSRDTLLVWMKKCDFPIYRYPEWRKLVFGPSYEPMPLWEERTKRADIAMRIRRHNVAVICERTGQSAYDVALGMMDSSGA